MVRKDRETINSICFTTEDLTGESLADRDIIICIMPEGEKVFCYISSELLQTYNSSELYSFYSLGEAIRILERGGNNRINIDRITRRIQQPNKLFRLFHNNLLVDSTIIEQIKAGHSIFYIYPSFICDLNDRVSNVTVHSAIPISDVLFNEKSLNEIRNSLLNILPRIITKEQVISRLIQDLTENIEQEEKERENIINRASQALTNIRNMFAMQYLTERNRDNLERLAGFTNRQLRINFLVFSPEDLHRQILIQLYSGVRPTRLPDENNDSFRQRTLYYNNPINFINNREV